MRAEFPFQSLLPSPPLQPASPRCWRLPPPPAPPEPQASAQLAALVRPNDVNSGSLLFPSKEPGFYVEAPRLATDFDIAVTGPIARTRVTQQFQNPSQGWVEGAYVFPLPENAAVDTLKMVIGERVIVGDIKERQEAKQIYEEAKAKGEKAALLEQERPTSSPTRSPISVPTKPSSSRSNISRRSASRAACSRCACRWSSPRATIRRRSSRLSSSRRRRFCHVSRHGAGPRHDRAAGARSAQERAGQSGDPDRPSQCGFRARRGEELVSRCRSRPARMATRRGRSA